MALRYRASQSSFDADAALEAVERVVDGRLYSFCEYDTMSFRPLYVDRETVASYEDRNAMFEHFERIHAHVHMDFMQINLLCNTLFPVADRVEYIATAMDFMKIIRVYVGDEGLFIAVEPEEEVTPLIEAIKAAIEWTDS